MARHLFAFAMLLLFLGSAFAGTTVSVGETIPVGGTTTTTTTTTTQTEPDEPAEGETDSSSPFGGMVMTNDEGDSILVGAEEGTFEEFETAEGEEGSTDSSTTGPSDSLTFGLPEGQQSSSAPGTETTSGQGSLCGPAFVVLLALAFFVSRS